jgi:hypothetical protein
VVGAGEPVRVLLGAEALPRVEAERLEAAPRGWAVQDGVTVVRLPDRFEAFRVTIEG